MLEPPAPFQLHPMDMSHVEAVLAVDGVSFPTPTRRNLYQYELTQNSLAHYQVLMADLPDDGPRLVGYAGFWMIAGEAHLSTIAVDPAWRGRGLGELLLSNMLFLANKEAAQSATLEVRRSNQVAQALYRKYRFQEVGVRRRYYRDTGEDALLMTVEALDASFYAMLEGLKALLFARLRVGQQDMDENV